MPKPLFPPLQAGRALVPRLALLLAACLPSSALHAQLRPVEQAESVRADVLGEPSADEPDEAIPGPEEVDPSADRTPLGVDFRMLRVIAHQDDADPDPALGEQRIEIDPAIPAPEGLQAVLEGYLDEPVSMAALAELARDVVESWRESDYPLVDVYFPEQNITEGKVQMVVREALLGAIHVEGARFSDPEYFQRQMRLEAGDRINRRRAESDLDWLNVNPIRVVNLIYDRGEADGTSDIILQVEEERPLLIYAGLANTGTLLTGENEWSAGLQWWNPLRIEHGIGYNVTSDFDFDTLQAHTLFYQAYLPWRHQLQLVGAYVRTDVDSIGDGVLPVGVRGESLQFSLDYRVPFGRVRSLGNLRQAVRLGVDYKLVNSDLLFDRVSVFENDVAVLQGRAGYEAAWRDRFGRTSVQVGGTYSPGNLVANNNDESFQQARDRARAEYFYATGEIERLVTLPADFSLRMRTLGQWSPHRLTSTEQLLAGGHLSVRGFDEYLVRGDSGVVLNVELLTPAVPVVQRFAGRVEDRLQLLAFYDSAWLWATRADAEFEPDIHIQSAGLGLRYRMGRSVQGRLAYGWNIGDSGVAGDPGSGRVHFGVTISY